MEALVKGALQTLKSCHENLLDMDKVLKEAQDSNEVVLDEPLPLVRRSSSKKNTAEKENYILKNLSLMKINSFSSAEEEPLNTQKDENLSRNMSFENQLIQLQVKGLNKGVELREVVNRSLSLTSQSSFLQDNTPAKECNDDEVDNNLLETMKEGTSQDSTVKIIMEKSSQVFSVSEVSQYSGVSPLHDGPEASDLVPSTLMATDNENSDLISVNGSETHKQQASISLEGGVYKNSLSEDEPKAEQILKSKGSTDSEENQVVGVLSVSLMEKELGIPNYENNPDKHSAAMDISAISLPIIQVIEDNDPRFESSQEKGIQLPSEEGSLSPRQSAEEINDQGINLGHSRVVSEVEVDQERELRELDKSIQTNSHGHEKCPLKSEKITIASATQTDTQENVKPTDFNEQSDGDSFAPVAESASEIRKGVNEQEIQSNFSKATENIDIDIQSIQVSPQELNKKDEDVNIQGNEDFPSPMETDQIGNLENSTHLQSTQDSSTSLQKNDCSSPSLEYPEKVNRSNSLMSEAADESEQSSTSPVSIEGRDTSIVQPQDDSSTSENIEAESENRYSQNACEEIESYENISTQGSSSGNGGRSQITAVVKINGYPVLGKIVQELRIQSENEAHMPTTSVNVSERTNESQEGSQEVEESEVQSSVSNTNEIDTSFDHKDEETETITPETQTPMETDQTSETLTSMNVPCSKDDSRGLSVLNVLSGGDTAKDMEWESPLNHTNADIVQEKDHLGEEDDSIIKSWSSANTVVLSNLFSDEENDDAERLGELKTSLSKSNDKTSVPKMLSSSKKDSENYAPGTEVLRQSTLSEPKTDSILVMGRATKESSVCETRKLSTQSFLSTSVESSNNEDVINQDNDIKLMARMNEEAEEETHSVKETSFEEFQNNVEGIQSSKFGNNCCKEQSIDSELQTMSRDNRNQGEKFKGFPEVSSQDMSTSYPSDNETETQKESAQVGIGKGKHLLSATKQEEAQHNTPEKFHHFTSNNMRRKLPAIDVNYANSCSVDKSTVEDTKKKILRKRKPESTIQHGSAKISRSDRILHSESGSKLSFQPCDKNQETCGNLQAGDTVKCQESHAMHSVDTLSNTSRIFKRKGAGLSDEPHPQKVPRKEKKVARHTPIFTRSSATRKMKQIQDYSLLNITQKKAQVFRAVSAGNLMLVKDLIQATGPAIRDSKGRTLLHLAAANDQCELIIYLLKIINPNIVDKDGQAPLHVAATKGNTNALRILLSDQDTDPDKRDPSMRTYRDMLAIPLFEAILEGDKKRIEILLELEANSDHYIEDHVGKIMARELRVATARQLAFTLHGDRYLSTLAKERNTCSKLNMLNSNQSPSNQSARYSTSTRKSIAGNARQNISRKKSEYPGHVCILNFKTFEGRPELTREGSDNDIYTLQKRLVNLGFTCNTHDSLTTESTMNVLKDFRDMEALNKSECAIVVVSGHSLNKDAFLTSDQKLVSTEWVMKLFRDSDCPQLKGKPKLFIFDFSTGYYMENLNIIQHQELLRVEEPHNDVMCLYSETNGLTYRGIAGHSFLSALNITLRDHSYNTEIAEFHRQLLRECAKNSCGPLPELRNYNFTKKFYISVQR